MWSRRVMRAMLLLLSCATATLPHQGEGGGGMDRILKPDRPRPDQTDGGEDGAWGGERENEDPRSRSFDDAAETADQNSTARPDPEPEPEPDPRTPSGTGPCFGLVEEHEAVGRDLLNAVLEGWGREREPEQEDLTRFGLCSDPDGNSTGLDAVLSALAKGVEKDRGGLHVLHPTKELWGADEEHQRRELTLRFLLPPPLPHSRLGGLAPVLIFALGGTASTGAMRVSFGSPSLLPHRQTVCVSAGTRYAVLTRRQTKDHGHGQGQGQGQGHVVLRITVEANRAEEGEKRSLQDLLTGEGVGRTGTQGPLLLFQSRILDSADSPSNGLAPEVSPSPGPLAPSRTFHFLCVLQKFLSEALSPEKAESVPAQAASVSLDSLQSLPPLTLGASSSESLLLGLLNSSAPTLFSFPRRAGELLEHRVELDLQPPLVAVLRLRLEEAAARAAREATGGCGLGDRLQRLRELGSLPGEGAAPPADKGSDREAQYRALLLFKALQTVLGAWEEERSLRSARGGQEGSGKGGGCRLQPLSVSLKSYVLEPATAAINNCEGPCGFPLAEANNHAILLHSHEQSGQPLGRSPCCVPLRYADLQVVELKGAGTEITIKPNMVAMRCGCR
ncbi:muellerian-inhibiting factor [Anguilla anguilla]|uniref:muellerian-inhibiting factor n=1 Tax=Anguilla anguilla TaxID=7936 RepID=UPI0015AFB554|nr:muellerian-inhibiting factor [Anguilla anguilla]